MGKRVTILSTCGTLALPISKKRPTAKKRLVLKNQADRSQTVRHLSLLVFLSAHRFTPCDAIGALPDRPPTKRRQLRYQSGSW
jgi:hypothetical protein